MHPSIVPRHIGHIRHIRDILEKLSVSYILCVCVCVYVQWICSYIQYRLVYCIYELHIAGQTHLSINVSNLKTYLWKRIWRSKLSFSLCVASVASRDPLSEDRDVTHSLGLISLLQADLYACFPSQKLLKSKRRLFQRKSRHREACRRDGCERADTGRL